MQYKCPKTATIILFILLKMKAELVVVSCFLMVIGSSQAQPWAANKTPIRQANTIQFQQSNQNTTKSQYRNGITTKLQQINRNTTQFQQRPFLQKQTNQPQIKGSQTRQPQSLKIQAKYAQSKPTLNAFQTNQAKRSNSQLKQSQLQTNQAQRKRTQFLGTPQKQNSLNLTKPNANRPQQRQSPTKQAANLFQQIGRTQNRTQTNLSRPQTQKPTSQFQTNRSRTSPIQQLRIPPKQSQRQRNVSVFQQKQIQTQRNRSLTKQTANNVLQAQTRNKSQTGQTPISLSSQRKQKAPQQFQQYPIQNRQISPQIIKNQFQIRQTGSQFQMDDQPLLNQILTENSTYPPQPHPFRMTPNYSQVLKQSSKYGIIRRAFSIGAAYFRNLLKVTPLPQFWTRYNNSWNCGNLFHPQYIKQGFNQNRTDIVINVDLLDSDIDNVSKTTFAQAKVCQHGSKPTYGLIQYVRQKIIAGDPLNVRTLIQTTIHQMLHVLAFSEYNHKEFKIKPNSNNSRKINQTEKCNWKNCSIITPKVMQYVRNYFNCDDQTGAILVSNKDLAHWNIRVFYDEIMTPIGREEGKKMTGLSLALWKIRDFSLLQIIRTRKRQLLEEAKAARLPKEYDRNKINHRYGQFCAQLQSNQNLTREFTFPGLICDDPLLSIQDPFTLTYYGRSSRCFNIEKDQYLIPACYKAKCRNGIIYIQIGKKSHACNKPGQWLSVGYSWKVQCPKDLKLFCAVPICHDLCEGRGVCVNGKCLYP